MVNKRFSDRIGIAREAPPVTIREDATPFLRYAVATEAAERGIRPHAQRHAICRLLRQVPDADNWSEGNVSAEVEGHLSDCPWFRIYDFAEEMYVQLKEQRGKAAGYEAALNEICVDTGIGWQLINGRFVSRGDAPFEATVHHAREAVASTRHATASREISEAINDLSRRPRPDKTGAVHHAMAAVECLAREVVGDTSPTLGDLIKRYREKLAIPRPLDQALEKVWGYTSEMARHVREGQEPGWPETELVVALSAALCAYLVRDGVSEPTPDANDLPF
jgi:AbiJ-like protein